MNRLGVLVMLVWTIVTHAQSPELRVVATTVRLAEVAQAVGGDLVQITTLVHADAQPDTYQPGADDLAAIAQADLLLVQGTGDEAFLADMFDSTDTPYSVVSEGLPMLGMAAPTLTAADASVYMTLTNTSRSDLTLITAEGDWFTGAMLHETMLHNGMAMMMMRDDGVALPSDEAIVFAPAGLHLMLTGVQTNLVAGQRYPLALRFSDGSAVSVEVFVTLDDPTPAQALNRVQGARVSVENAYVYPLTVFVSAAAQDLPLGRLGDDVVCAAIATDTDPQPLCNAAVTTDPMTLHLWAGNLALIFAEADPDNAAFYKEAAAAYQVELDTVDSALRAAAGALPADCTLVSATPRQWAYAAARYGLTFTLAAADTTDTSWDDLLRSPVSAVEGFRTLSQKLTTADC